MLGGGRYDRECTAALLSTKADGVILIVLNGDRGNGFSAQLPLTHVSDLPTVLRQVADEIQADVRKSSPPTPN